MMQDGVTLYLTSLKNSPGIAFNRWKDGKPLSAFIFSHHYAGYNIQPELYKFLKQTGKCQDESFYECIASKLDTMEFKGCSQKCMPNIFSNIGMNISTPFCQNDLENEKCALNIGMKIIDQNIDGGSGCKKSCLNLVYSGEITATYTDLRPYIHEEKVNLGYAGTITGT